MVNYFGGIQKIRGQKQQTFYITSTLKKNIGFFISFRKMNLLKHQLDTVSYQNPSTIVTIGPIFLE